MVHKVIINYSMLIVSLFQYPNEDIRVILINSYSNVAKIVICEVRYTHNYNYRVSGLSKVMTACY